MIVYALVRHGQVVEERRYPAALEPGRVKQIDGLPILRPVQVDEDVPPGHRAVGTEYLVEDHRVIRRLATEAIPLEEARATKLAEIRAEGDRRMAALVAGYTRAERETWHQQVREAAAYGADPAAQTPLLAAIAAGRGLSLAAMVQRVADKAAAYNAAVGAVLGALHALEQQAEAAADTAALAALDPGDPAHWPSGGS